MCPFFLEMQRTDRYDQMEYYSKYNFKSAVYFYLTVLIEHHDCKVLDETGKFVSC